MKLDEYQQAVTACNRNAVVSAGAGSGKTTVLAGRFLRLIEEGYAEVSEILTLTFTRKAAAEMYERIYNLLLDDIDNPEAAAAVSDFDKASISTLDSFCSRITRDCSAAFGLPSSFKTDESAVKRLAEEASLDFILENSEDEYLKEFIFINGFENVWKNFFIRISMNYLAVGDPKDFTAIFARQMEEAESALADFAAAADSLVAEINTLAPVSRTIASAQAQLQRLSGLGESAAEALRAEDGSILFKNLGSRLAAVKLGKPGGKSVKEEIIRYKELVDDFRETVEILTELAGTLENRRLLKELFRLTADFQEELFNRKRAAGLLGFHDVLTIAVAGLRQDPELRRYYKGLFRFIMIDEFQDNNSLQKELLYLLAERDGNEADGLPSVSELNPSKLFFVGDEKQSIYRFRGADVSVFKQLSSEIESAGGVSLSLKRNYRSEPGLIDFFNNVFSFVMRDCSEDYQAAFESLESRDAALAADPEIKLLYKPWDAEAPEDSLSAEESEAYAIAEYIIESVGSLEVGGRVGTHPADYSDFAILFRSGTNQKTYEQVFRAKGIPYTVHSVRSLFQEAPVNDIYNLLQICLYPDDRSAQAAFLRSPLINLSDFSVVDFLRSKKPVFAEDQEGCCRTDKDLLRYRAARGLYQEISSRLDREPLSGIISDIWYKSGYRYLILRDSSLHGYLEYFDYLHQLAVNHDQQGGTTADFLDHLRENLGEYRKLDELKILGYSAGGVQIMPVHQSKGLEFPVVIIANAGNTGINDREGSTPAYISPEAGLSFNLVAGEDGKSGRCNYFYSRGKEENRVREEAELRRLLYVALTRAENHLVVSGCHGYSNRRGERSMLNMFMSAFGWVEDADPFACRGLEPYISLIENKTWADKGSGARGSVDMKAAAQQYQTAEIEHYISDKIEYSATELNAAVAGQVDVGGESAGRLLPGLEPKLELILQTKELEADFGTLCHRLIEWAIHNECWDAFPSGEIFSEELRPFFRSFDDSEWPLAVTAAAGLAAGFFNTDIWKDASGSLGFESELPFTSRRNEDGREIFVNGIIDLVFEAEDSVRIIDFKTDRRIVSGEYDRQMRIYIDAAQEIYSKPAVCSLFYLRGCIEVEIS